MEPITIVVALAGAAGSLVSALWSAHREKKEEEISVVIGGKELKITSANRKEIEEALSKIESQESIQAAQE